MAAFPAPAEGFLLTYFIASSDVDRSRRFYTEVLGGETVLEGCEFSIVAWSRVGRCTHSSRRATHTA